MNLGAIITSRLGALFATVFILQVSVVPHFRLGGYVIDLPLILVVLVGLHLTPQNGSLTGFMVGLMIDLALETPFGMTALTFSLIGFAAGSASPHVVERSVIIRALTVALLGATATALFAGFGVLIGLEYVSRRELGDIALVTAVAAIPIATLLSPLVRWSLALRSSPVTSDQ